MTVRQEASLHELARLAAEAEAGFLAAHGEEMEAWRKEITRAVQESNERLRQEVCEIAGGARVCADLMAQMAEYVDWLQWSFWDLAYFAVAIRPDPTRFRHGISTCGLVYLAVRIFDDVIDRHFWYKARRPTLLAAVAEQHPVNSQGVEGLTLLAGLLLFGDAVLRMSGDGDGTVRTVLDSFRRAVLGAILEHAPREEWTPAYYERLVQLKNVDFWRCLYAAIDPAAASPLHPFLERYYALAQKLNDVQDFAEDQQRGQPNLLSLYLPRNGGPPPAGAAPAEVEAEIAADFLALAAKADSLPPLERSVAWLKLGESLREAFRLGLFPGAAPAPAPIGEAGEEPLGLQWYSTLGEIVERRGLAALVEVDCPVCGSGERRRLFEKQGFALHRCAGCTHVYVTPRIPLDLQLRMARELEEDDVDNAFLEVQRIYAEPICHLLHLRAPGPRLLDLGFGRGYILRLARAYGFEAYGVDSSRFLVDQLRPEFGDRLHFAAAGAEPVPWDSFDVIMMSHVVEHLADPPAVLRDLHARLNPGGLLYAAVPDLEGLQYRLFGKHWDVINPLVHFQYFNQASLSRLLTDCGFEAVERVQYPPLPRAITPRWMRLMRKLGGNESGELAVVARRPGGDEPSLLAPPFLESPR